MFKGTEQRPSTAHISRELDSVGAEFNAFTGKDHTGYYITVDNSHFPLAVDIISDMMYHAKFDSADIDRERGVIVEEINMYEDNPLMYIEDVFERLLFNKAPLSQLISGPRVNVQTISRQALYNYYRKFYYNGNAVIGVAGKFQEKKVLDLVNKLFPLDKKRARIKIQKTEFSNQQTPRVYIMNRSLEQVQLMLGFKNVAGPDPKFLISKILSNILGGTMSSRLFLEIREKLSLCYFIKTAAQGYEDIGSFTVQAGLNKEKIYESLEAIKAELNKIKDKGITQEELHKAKDNIRGRLILKLEDPSNYLNFLASQELVDQKIKDLEDKLREVDKVTLTQVNNSAQDIIDWRRANLAIIGPFDNQTKFLKILNS